MRRLHWIVGLVGVIAFLMTGLYMRRHDPRMIELDGGTRMMFRSRHIYLLLSSLLNLGLGTYCRLSQTVVRRSFQIFGSLPILAGPPLLLAAFFREPYRSEPGRPLTICAVIGMFVGAICHAIAGWGSARREL